MAVIYRAIADGAAGFSRAVVIKRILPSLSGDPSFATMLVSEARLCGLLHHPNIVQVHELGHVATEYYLAMEYIDGFDLSTILNCCADQGRSIPPGVCAFIIQELL